MAQVYVITGGRNSGKTALLVEMMGGYPGAEGLLTVPEGGSKDILYLLDTASGERRLLMEADAHGVPRIGRYRYLPQTFLWAEEKLSAMASKTVFLDEVGRLELEGCGFSNALRNLLDKDDIKLFLTVRKDFLADVISCFGLSGCHVIEAGSGSCGQNG